MDKERTFWGGKVTKLWHQLEDCFARDIVSQKQYNIIAAALNDEAMKVRCESVPLPNNGLHIEWHIELSKDWE